MSLKSKIYAFLVFNLENFTPARIFLHVTIIRYDADRVVISADDELAPLQIIITNQTFANNEDCSGAMKS